MDYRALIYILLISTIVIADYPRVPCLAEKNRYYHKQLKKCRPCDKCLPGEEIDLTVQLEVSDVYGALKCRPCKQCPPGMYNRRRAFKCKPCRNCTDAGRSIKTACAPNRNEVCGRRIKDNTSTPESTKLLPRGHPGASDHVNRERTFKADYVNNGHTFLNSQYHSLIPALVVPLVLFTGVILTIGMVRLYPRGKNRCLTCPNNIIGDTHPIMTHSNAESTNSSVVSGIRHSYPHRNHTRNGMTGSVNTTAYHQIGDNEDTSDTEDQNRRHQTNSTELYRHTVIRKDDSLSQLHTEDQNTLYQIHSKEPYRQTVIRQDGHLLHTEDDSYELFSDVEEDVPSSVIIDRSNSPTLTTDAVQYMARTDLRKCLPHKDVPNNEQALVALPGHSKSANCKIDGKRKNEVMEYVQKLSKYIATDDTYRQLGRHLNVSTTDIDIIEADYDKVQECAYRTLQKWKQCNPYGNIDDLKQGICDIGRKDILDKIPS
ncbi:uncharacterized protein LOC117329053 isoform X2 [Pecten maximus]|nr:uncharacterized protein LOC117329053 isoform X2 [Pecten maximus]